MSVPKVVWVDGCTSSGKDYFIDKFINLYSHRYPDARVKSIRAIDVVLSDKAQSENRKYTTYDTPLELVQSVYQGHLHLLEMIRRICDEMKNPKDVVIVNRSFLSYHIYNWQTLSDSLSIKGNYETLKALSMCDEVSYALEFKKRLGDIPTLFVNLSGNTVNHEEKLKLLVDRIKARLDGKPINEEWISKLITAYNKPSRVFLDIFTNTKSVDSGDHVEILNQWVN